MVEQARRRKAGIGRVMHGSAKSVRFRGLRMFSRSIFPAVVTFCYFHSEKGYVHLLIRITKQTCFKKTSEITHGQIWRGDQLLPNMDEASHNLLGFASHRQAVCCETAKKSEPPSTDGDQLLQEG